MTLPIQKKYTWTPNGMEDHPNGMYMLHDTHFRDEVVTLRAQLTQHAQTIEQLTRLNALYYDDRKRLTQAQTALKIAGYTLKEGAEAWKPPLGPSVSPLLETVDHHRREIHAVKDIAKAWKAVAEDKGAELGAMTTRFNETVKSFHEAIAREALALQQLATAEATVKSLRERLCIEKILKHSRYGLRRPMTPEPSQTCLPRLAQILQRLHAIEREKIQLERELRDLKLTESKTLLTES